MGKNPREKSSHVPTSNVKENSPRDVNGRVIQVGDTVNLRSLIGRKDTPVTFTGEVLSTDGMHGNPGEPMIWIEGKRSCHHPKACEVISIPILKEDNK